MQPQRYLVIHGHFYQPPRENPWLGVIEKQESAAPFHNWNERITVECYKANTLSRTLDKQGRILDIINNYKYLSFNFGPTLLNWIQLNHPATYEAILEADRESLALNNGHGNAIAQVYNHIIMPLATREEQKIQINLGIKDFTRHFGREPESLWLAETAINETTLELLVKQGLRFIILSPFQALKVKRMGRDDWRDVGNGDIDTTMPYRLFSKNGDFLDVFFFNKEVSTAVAFEHLLRDAHRFGAKLSSSLGRDGYRPMLMNICTDGESYGHHEAYGDMCLASFFSGIAQEHRFRVTNYGFFLDRFPPFMEVALKPGKDGAGTSWSCRHGVDRWRADCGCSTGSHAGWNQQWRAPLRESLRKLKTELDGIFEQGTREYFPDPWSVFPEFAEVRRSRSREDAQRLFDRLACRPLDGEERSRILQLFESQFNACLMFTSCGWFFDDISGLEPLQNLKYAARAIEMSGRRDLREILLGELRKAAGNLDGETGETLYLKYVVPHLKTCDLIANQAVMEWGLLGKEGGRYFFYDVSFRERERFEHHGLALGNVEVKDPFLGIRKDYFFFCADGEEDFLETWVREDLSREQRSEVRDKLTRWARGQSGVAARRIGEEFGFSRYGLADLLEVHRGEILGKATARAFEGLKQSALDFFNRNEDLIRETVRFGLDLPPEVRLAASYAIHHKLKFELRYLEEKRERKCFNRVIRMFRFARQLELPLKTDFEKDVLQKILMQDLETLSGKQDFSVLEEIKGVLEIMSNLEGKVDLAPAQNILFKYLKGPFQESARQIQETGREDPFRARLLVMAEEDFGINVDRFKEGR